MAENRAQKGKPTADTVKPTIAKEELEKAVHPTKRAKHPTITKSGSAVFSFRSQMFFDRRGACHPEDEGYLAEEG